MKENRISLSEKLQATLSRELELPNLFSETDIRLCVSQGMQVCGIEDVMQYTPQKIIFKLRRNHLVIDGDDLQIDCCENGMAILHGALLGFSFTEGGALQC